MEVTGKIKINHGLTVVGNNNLQKCEVMITTEDQYPKDILIQALKERADALSKVPVGERIKASINIETKEFNGKYYTSVTAWKFDKL